MNVAEVPLLLSGLSQFQFVEASEVAVQIWAGALDEDMPVDFAVRWIAGYYGRPTAEKVAPVIPGNLNRAWRDEKAARRASEQRRTAITGSVDLGVPMPDYVKEAWQKIADKTRIPDEDEGAA